MVRSNLDQSKIQQFRQDRLIVIEDMLSDVAAVASLAGCSTSNILLVRRELVAKKKRVVAAINENSPLSEEEIFLFEQWENEE